MSPLVTLCTPDFLPPLTLLLRHYGLHVSLVEPSATIPGSYWGECEAGLIGDRLFLRNDTPLHSALHEACHYICMDDRRRAGLHTDAGGEIVEENAVCYLQALLADDLPGYDRHTLLAEMDAWGYTFRLGSAQAWFENDADDAQAWLLTHRLIDADARPTGLRVGKQIPVLADVPLQATDKQTMSTLRNLQTSTSPPEPDRAAYATSNASNQR